ncbi:4-oxalocrotonate tautomerase [Heliobacterium gestii]|uniref:4-oxalocrotonate tautomerase n=1 Tax=Heliomicrobium gestii TaxID=2699 RepID=A0A845LDU3_HELGE|nr:tautomerase family protein [Heliomicrobium gestii]MBM7867051.1 4-oxalocrotonate tautomerase [Heliomicrobium gestii]MZP43534.1 4-oxalocrotonate tautomerase [Heliomicrobium gestii]
MPIVNITMLEGRTEDQKRAATEAIKEALVQHCGAKTENVVITIVDVPTTNVYMNGMLVSDRRRNPG